METAMDIVRRAQRGEIDHDELVRILKTWRYEPQYKTTGLEDDWQMVPNSFDAVEFAYMSLDLLTEEDYTAILLATQ
ncbi:hypothetical protein Q9S36_51535 [Microbacterium sp. ARD31]|jgi:hypothetical protein|uniref:hypothetical protein n=1 Tax=Microbacterium sp. ARD31 TaxID=2962576 RepID=UPI0028825964|nr:hypothetical protein [Microbacterium sp. ARD31]MDT0188645.1 hypothetical protein [Microbacterium sp. ARD31]